MIRIFFVSLCFVLLFSVTGESVLAQGDEIGRIKTIDGEAFVVRGDQRSPAELGDSLFVSDLIETGADGSLGIVFNDNTTFSAGPNTRLALQEFAFDSSSMEGTMLADLLSGTLAVTSGDIARGSPDAMRLRTPAAVLGVRGTRFLVRVRGD